MPNKGLESVRADLATRLPRLIEAAAESYEDLASAAPVGEPREQAQHHAACKAALAHLDMLTKLAKWAEAENAALPPPGSGAGDLIASARSALADMGS